MTRKVERRPDEGFVLRDRAGRVAYPAALIRTCVVGAAGFFMLAMILRAVVR